MATPRITYDKYAQTDDWQTIRISGSSNGLVVPDSLLKARRTESLEKARQDRAVLFGEYTRTRMQGLNSQSQGPSDARAKPQVLTALSRKSSIDAQIISKIISTIQRFCKVSHLKDLQLGFRVAHKRERDMNFRPTPEEQEAIDVRCRRMEKLVLNTTRELGQTFKFFMGLYISNELTIDRKVMIKQLDSKRRPTSYYWIPGGTVQPTYRILKPYMEEWGQNDPSMYNPARAAERLSSRLYKDGKRDKNGNIINLTKASYVQVVNEDRIVAAFEPDEIHVDMINGYAEMDEIMWGFSPLEQSIGLSMLWIQATDYTSQLLNISWPEAIMVLHGDYDQEGLEVFKQTVLADHGNSQRLPIIAAGAQQDGATAEMLQLRPTPTEMLFGDLLQMIRNQKCDFYGIRPISINETSPNIDTAAQQGVNYSVPEANDPGIRGRMENSSEIITQEIIEPWEPDLEMVWCGLDSVPEDARIQRELGLQSMKTFNESRSSVGLPELPKGIPGDDIGDWVPNPQYIAAIGQILADKAQNSAGAPQNPSELSQPSGSGGSGDFGQGDSMPDGSAGDGTQPQSPPSPTQPVSPQSPTPPIQGASQ